MDGVTETPRERAIRRAAASGRRYLRRRGTAVRETWWPAEVTGRYGSPEVDLLRAVVAAYRGRGGGGAGLGRFALRHPKTALRAAIALLRLPRLEVSLSDRPEGRLIARHLVRHSEFAGWRRASAALQLPADEASYLRGKARGRLRTNVSRARDAGIRCRRVTEAAEQVELLRQVGAARGPAEPTDYYIERFVGPEPYNFFATEDADGRLINLCVLVVDGYAALVAYHVSLPDHPHTSPARWLASLHVINETIRRGARVLVVESSALDLDSGLAFFQARLGYQVVNLRLRRGAKTG